jgi:hypothetical protein
MKEIGKDVEYQENSAIRRGEGALQPITRATNSPDAERQ